MDPATLFFLIPIIAVVMTFGSGMLASYLNYRKRQDILAMHHEHRMTALQKGIELPPLPEDFFKSDGQKSEDVGQKLMYEWLGHNPARNDAPGHGTLLGGLILVFIALSVYLSLHFTMPRMAGGGDVALFALIPGFIGVALLVYYAMVGRSRALAWEEEQKARRWEAGRTAKAEEKIN